MIRLVCTEDGSAKFWEANVEGSALTTRWGKLGTEGQTKTKPFADGAAAQKELAKLIHEKRGKGYVDDGAKKSDGAKQGAATKSGEKETATKSDGAKAASAPASGEPARHKALTDCGIIALFDASHVPSIVDQASWEAALLADEDILRHVAAGHLVPLATGADGRFTIDVVVGDALPASAAKAVTDASAPYLFDVKGRAFVGGLEHVYAKPDAKSASSVALAPGRYAATVHAMKGKGQADVLVLLRPIGAKEAFTGRASLTLFEPKPKAALTKIRTQKEAQRAALQGRIDEAVAAFTKLADEKGDVQAMASLAEIHAYRQEWDAFLPRAVAVMKNRKEVVGNTVTELPWLLIVAGRASGAWDVIATCLDEKRALIPERQLIEQVKSKGKAEVVEIDHDDAASLGPDERETGYADAIANDEAEAKDPKNKKKQKPGDREKSRFLIARAWGMEAIALEALAAAGPHLDWYQTIDAARLLAKHGRDDEAWALIELNLKQWWPVSFAQVAPIDLLEEAALRRVMTKERCAKVLATARGWEREGA